ncbi:MAG: sensor histidine kinase [Lachnospiraceae bacterium]|nr:sensor histidine kinase [Lachnospiraceae bacterium]
MKRKRQFYFFLALLLPVMLFLNGVLFYSMKCTGEYMQSENVWGMKQSVKVGDYARQKQILKNLPEDSEAALAAIDEIITYLELSEVKKNDVYAKYMEALLGHPWYPEPTDPEDNELIPDAMVTMGISSADMANYERVRECVENAAKYGEYATGVAENAGVIADSLYSIYDDSWLLKNLAQCQKDYYGLEFLKLTPELDNSFELVINYHVTDVFALLFALAVTILFWRYIRNDSFGEIQNVTRTTVAMLVLMVLGLIGFYGIDFAIVHKVYELPSLGAPLQSLENFYVCPYQITVGGFMAAYIGIKVLTLLLVLGICILAYTARKRLLSCGLALAFFVFEFIRHFDVPEQNAAGVFGEINLFSGFTPERFYNRYLNLNVAGLMLPRLQTFLAVLLVVFLVAAVFVYRRFGRWHKTSRQEAMNVYFGEIDKRYQETRLLWHDFNNHLLAIKALYENGHEAQAAKYIDDLSEQSYARLLPAKSGSDTLDLLLFKKHQQANEMGVTVRFKMGCSLAGLAITDYDMCSLFGNILDNAIEAVRKVKTADAEVVLRVEQQNSMLYICCENPYVGELMKQDGELKTTKKDTAKHGIGLSSVKHICKKYNGNLEVETTDNVFRVSVLLNV